MADMAHTNSFYGCIGIQNLYHFRTTSFDNIFEFIIINFWIYYCNTGYSNVYRISNLVAIPASPKKNFFLMCQMFFYYLEGGGWSDLLEKADIVICVRMSEIGCLFWRNL